MKKKTKNELILPWHIRIRVARKHQNVGEEWRGLRFQRISRMYGNNGRIRATTNNQNPWKLWKD